ncbi:hypothetical protein [Pontibacter sp. G13]|uniref:hypothetical protein n=1 Tax=Pontibacter sp. G13 TaxID=3074898 RepID=UPI00288938F7|nr:hypothetical protein [Pontibacter sp. G13]WNJ17002.1 hypothetical protein RJD25_19280 [Pontibacter sp. G13]
MIGNVNEFEFLLGDLGVLDLSSSLGKKVAELGCSGVRSAPVLGKSLLTLLEEIHLVSWNTFGIHPLVPRTSLALALTIPIAAAGHPHIYLTYKQPQGNLPAAVDDPQSIRWTESEGTCVHLGTH